jgi:hypothetical protein
MHRVDARSDAVAVERSRYARYLDHNPQSVSHVAADAARPAIATEVVNLARGRTADTQQRR